MERTFFSGRKNFLFVFRGGGGTFIFVLSFFSRGGEFQVSVGGVTGERFYTSFRGDRLRGGSLRGGPLEGFGRFFSDAIFFIFV